MAAQILFGLVLLLVLFVVARQIWLSKHWNDDDPLYPTEPRPRKTEAPRRAAEANPAEPPPSLRPVINENRCIGCGSCVAACPENDVLGIIDFETQLINPSRCMGHGACVSACPMDAITLTMGTAVRGEELPILKPNFSTRIPGLYIAGELGGMGLIRNAIAQGRQAMESIRRLKNSGEGEGLDVVIIGAGPAGLSAALTALARGLRYVVLEQGELGGALLHFPRHKIVQSGPVKLPVFGEVDFNGKDKEALLALWQRIQEDTGVKINCNERVEAITRQDNGFLVRSSLGKYHTRAVLVATGRGGTPKTLHVPGESLPKVAYRLIDPSQYRGRHVLVVGGGDSAVEAAFAILLEKPASITLCHHGDKPSRCNEQNRERLAEFQRTGRVKVIPQAQVKLIGDTHVEIQSGANTLELPNDDVIACIGGSPPDELYKGLGL
jgi:thioredoxin reductase/ferredoxin